MLIIVLYDIAVSSPGGSKRLNKAAKACLAYGQRIQNSVYECDISQVEYLELKDKLLSILDLKIDKLRFYKLGKQKKGMIEKYGRSDEVNLSGSLIF